jgi:hypothetical protein
MLLCLFLYLTFHWNLVVTVVQLFNNCQLLLLQRL